MAQKVLSDETYRIGWDLKGFKKEDIGEEEFNDLTERFLKIYDEWVKIVDEMNIYDEVEQEYFKLLDALESRNCFKHTCLGKYWHASYMCHSLNDILIILMYYLDCFNDDKLIPYFDLDGNMPDFRCGIKEKPDWSIGFYLVPVKKEES